jgi:hypothetical protein
MKCHSNIIFVVTVILVLNFKTGLASPDAESKTTTLTEDLPVEHRGAKPEPFLDQIAAFFGGGGNANKKVGHQNQQKRPMPIYQQTSASIQRPQSIRAPPRPPTPPQIPLRPQKRPQPPPPRYTQNQAPSNNFQTFVPPSTSQGKTKSYIFIQCIGSRTIVVISRVRRP